MEGFIDKFFEDPQNIIGFLGWIVAMIAAGTSLFSARTGSAKQIAEATKILLEPLRIALKECQEKREELESTNEKLIAEIEVLHVELNNLKSGDPAGENSDGGSS